MRRKVAGDGLSPVGRRRGRHLPKKKGGETEAAGCWRTSLGVSAREAMGGGGPPYPAPRAIKGSQ